MTKKECSKTILKTDKGFRNPLNIFDKQKNGVCFLKTSGFSFKRKIVNKFPFLNIFFTNFT